MNQKAEERKTRTRAFALDVIRFASGLPRTPANDVMTRQLLKSATGVASNYRSACRSRSHAEFVARIGVVLEEADETEGWLELLKASALSLASPALRADAAPEDLNRLINEAAQLRAIFAASSLTAGRARSR